MSLTDYAIIVFGAYILFELHRMTDRLSRIADALETVKVASTIAADNSAWLERMDQRLELIEMHSDSSQRWLMHMVNAPEPKYRDV